MKYLVNCHQNRSAANKLQKELFAFLDRLDRHTVDSNDLASINSYLDSILYNYNETYSRCKSITVNKSLNGLKDDLSWGFYASPGDCLYQIRFMKCSEFDLSKVIEEEYYKLY